VAHEINNPLTGVLTYASFLQKRCDEKPEWREDLDVIVRETKRCREIVRGLLEFSRQTPPRRQPTQIGEVAERAVAITANQLALSHVKLDLDLARDLPTVLADGNQIEQVLVNLILNAADAVVQYTGRIELATRRLTNGTDAVEVRVSDNGRGIRQADLPRIFEPFFTTKSAKGTGLGLAVSWGIVQAHGGKLEVASSDGKGTTFSVRLPVQSARSATNPSYATELETKP
jgi:two-component system NtrC family sensor kinase